MEVGWGGVRIGVNVVIQRTDGRVHPALVSGVNTDNKTVTVEWFEKGETKGKEIELEAVIALNPHLSEATNVNKEVNSNKFPNKSTLPINVANNKGSLNKLTRPSYVTPRPGTQNGHTDIIASSAPTSATLMPPPPPSTTTPTNMQPPSTNQATVNAARLRRSNVVKEVEKLKKNREERRARHAEQKAEKQELMNLDPGNPNWEFIAMIREFRGALDYKPLRNEDTVGDHQISVCVRKRPLNKKEIVRKEVDVITVPNKEHMVIHEPKTKVDLTKYLENQYFRFDYAFDESVNNDLVYKFTAKPLVHTIFDGGMATCFAYGQTGSGKTHTMGGDFNGKTQDCSKGIYALAAKDVFQLIRSPKYRSQDLALSCSFFEIYSGKVFDLLNAKTKLRVLEDGKQQVQIVNLRENNVDKEEDVLKLIQLGNAVRTSGQTSANQHSSRSHAVFQIILRKKSTKKLHGKFSLIDLAGNERGADTSSANRQTRMEGAEINKSLLALKECIRALGRKGAHLPFRASKLTQVLRDSFIGEKSRTCMIAMISPGMSSCEHSLNTLRYADRVKELGVQDAEMKQSPSSDEESNGNDLAQLRSLNEGDMSADMYTFHEAVSHVQDMEEEVLDQYRAVIERRPRWMDMDKALLQMSNEVDYDVDAFAQQLEDHIGEQVDSLVQLKEKVAFFRRQLLEEEALSKNIVSYNNKK